MKRIRPQKYTPIEGEIFIPIKQDARYQISNQSRVLSLCKEKYPLILNQRKDKNGYMVVAIKANLKVHRLVGEAFIENPLNLPQINHKNGIKHDNSIDNLEWCTLQHNITHSIETGLNTNREEGHPNAKLKKEDVLYIREQLQNSLQTVKQLRLKFNISDSQIRWIRDRRTWKNI